MKNFRIGFFPAHPAQFWMMKSLADCAPDNAEVVWFIRDKDVTLALARELNLNFVLVSKAGSGIIGNACELFTNIFKFLYYSKRYNIDFWLSKYGSVNISSWLLRIDNFSFNDDDEDIVPLIAATSYPFANKVLCTNWTRTKNFKNKIVKYRSFHELFYLHPSRFKKNRTRAYKVLEIDSHKPYALIRLSSMSAHHDIGESGVSSSLLSKVITKLSNGLEIVISSETNLSGKLEDLQLNCEKKEQHNILANAAILVTDSQTMAAEAAVLGVPNIRISSFAKRIGYLEALEEMKLTKGFKPDNESGILNHINYLLNLTDSEVTAKLDYLLKNTLDPVPFFWNEICSYLNKG
ncbi:hypothetical protein HII17_10825 [Thalassotalea sp. M1531]|uniref:DUF354 domain-containing protein n=1 Tax=Thalassotalea algicola TaxID=2716224 RepID=A0A7Y0LD20_9GAMM|nr:hypothetical protein [Thalassotalea algicola]NMP32062.1 hypothetical protein [Thalassotalea algicola]